MPATECPPARTATSRPSLAGEGERRDDVVGRRAARDERGRSLDHRVEERAGVLVGGIAGLVQAAAQAEAQLVGGGLEGVHRGSTSVMDAATLRARGPRDFAGSGHLARMAGTGQASGSRAGPARAA